VDEIYQGISEIWRINELPNPRYLSKSLMYFKTTFNPSNPLISPNYLSHPQTSIATALVTMSKYIIRKSHGSRNTEILKKNKLT